MLIYATGLIAMFALGHLSARVGLPAAHAQGGEKAAYLIASTSPLHCILLAKTLKLFLAFPAYSGKWESGFTCCYILQV
jgi:hypothetical protein